MQRRLIRVRRIVGLLLVFALVVAACGDDDDAQPTTTAAADTTAAGDTATTTTAAPAEAVVIDYWLWDDRQQPFYEQCAADFEAANPGIDIQISQFGWGDYWTGLTTAFASDTAPDVFTDHLAKYPEFVNSGVLLPLNEFAARDGVEDIFFPGLADLWVDPDGNRYGFPKDWDTIAVAANQAMLADAGLTVDDFAAATWNPDDGGTFEGLLRRLSIDANGVRGDEDGFDPSNVAVYGFGIEGNFGPYGQTTFSAFAASTGFEFLNSNPWGTAANYDDPRLAATISWFRHGIEEGFIAPLEDTQSLGGLTLYQNGTVATMTNGSWTINSYAETDGVTTEWAPLPAGPEGRRSMFNGLADSITTSAEDPEAAWKWVRHLASPDCQNIVGDGAIVFPAIAEATERAKAGHAANGIDVSAFTTHVEEGTTFLFPITNSASQVESILAPVMDAILLGEEDDAQGALSAANEQVNALLGN